MKRKIMPLLLFTLLLTGTVLFVKASGSPNYYNVKTYATKMEGYIQFQPSYVQDDKRAVGGSLSTKYMYRDPYSGQYFSDTLTVHLPSDKLPTDNTVYNRSLIHYKKNDLGDFVNSSYSGRFDWMPVDSNISPVNNPENPVGQ